MKIDKSIIEKVECGDGLTDKELKSAIKFYKDLVESLEHLGHEFRLALWPLRVTLSALESYAHARKFE